MKKNISIQLKATFLLIVFGLNTMVGFACGIGIDMGFNSTHHKEEDTTEIHVHADTKNDNHHNQSVGHQDEEKRTDSKEKKNCCNDEVQKLQCLDKALNQNAKTSINAPVFASIISTFLGIDIFNSAKAYPPKYIVRFFHPPPPDIRIAIQSLQI